MKNNLKFKAIIWFHFFDTLYGVSFAFLKSNSLFCCMEKSSFDVYKNFPFEHDGEYIMILYIYGCTVPLNMD